MYSNLLMCLPDSGVVPARRVNPIILVPSSYSGFPERPVVNGNLHPRPRYKFHGSIEFKVVRRRLHASCLENLEN